MTRNKRILARRRKAGAGKGKFVTIFINGRQERVPRPQLIEGLPVEEYIAANADPIWLHQNGLWESITPDLET